MVDYTNESNIKFGKFIAGKNNVEEKNVLYFAVAYAIFNTMEKNITDKNTIGSNQPTFLAAVRKTLNDVNELSPVDIDVIRNYILKFAEYYNTKISGDFLGITSIYSIFNIDAIFGFSLLELVNKHLPLFKEAVTVTAISKLVSDDLVNKFLIGE